MDVKASSVIRVIISGEWIFVEPGTFVVQDYVFVDDQGNEINRSHEPAYHFVSTNGDPYFGPLSAIQLIKLRPRELDGLRDPDEEAASRQPDPADVAAEAEAKKADAAQDAADSLFSDPLPMPVGDTAERGRGLL